MGSNGSVRQIETIIGIFYFAIRSRNEGCLDNLFQAIAKMEAELGHRINPEDDEEVVDAPMDDDDLS